MLGWRCALAVAVRVVVWTCQGLPADMAQERADEWIAELSAFAQDPEYRFVWQRSVSMLLFAVGLRRAARDLRRGVFSDDVIDTADYIDWLIRPWLEAVRSRRIGPILQASVFLAGRAVTNEVKGLIRNLKTGRFTVKAAMRYPADIILALRIVTNRHRSLNYQTDQSEPLPSTDPASNASAP